MTPAGRFALAAAAALLLPGCTSFADTAAAPTGAAAPTTAAEPPLRRGRGRVSRPARRSPIPTGRWWPSTSASPTTG